MLERFGSDLSGLRVAVDCANGAYSDIAPKAFERLGAEVFPLATEPDGSNINVGCGATDLSLLSRVVREEGVDLGFAFDGDGDRMLAVDAEGNSVDGDQIVAILALHLGVDLVVVTVMTNLGFHRLMEEHGIRVLTTDSELLRELTLDPSSPATSSASTAMSPETVSPRRCSCAGRWKGARLPRRRP